MMQSQDRVEKLEGYGKFEAEFRRSKLFKNLLAGLRSKEVAEALTDARTTHDTRHTTHDTRHLGFRLTET